MGQETDRIKQSSDQSKWQTPSSTNVGAELDFANIMNTIGQGLLVTGEGWRFEFVNPAFARLIGRPIEDLIGKSMDEFVIPEDLQLLLKHRSERLAGKTTSYEVRLRRPDGKIVWVHVTGVPRLIEDRIAGSISLVDDLTEQKEIEAALKAERDRAEIYLNIAEVILLALDTEARITLLNRKGYQIIGYEEGQLIGRDWIKTCLRPQDHESVHEVNRKIIKGEIDPFEYYENYVLTKDSEERRIAWHTTLLRDANNKIIGTLSSGEDITDRKRAEEALIVSEEKFRKAFIGSPHAVGISTLDGGRYLDVNDNFEKLTGWSRSEVIGRTSRELDIFQNYSERDKVADIIKNNGRIINYEVNLKTKSGENKIVEFSAELVDVSGQRCLLAHVTDITERKHTEERLQDSEDKFRTLFNSASDAIFIHDLKGHFFEVNQVACDRLGYSHEELLQMSPRDIDTPDSAAKVQGHIEEIILVGHKIFESAQVRRDGTTIPVEMNARLIDYKGKKAILAVARDITERKRSEDALKESENKYRQLAEVLEENLGFIQHLIDAIPNPIFYKDVNDIYKGCNSAFEKYLGLSKKEIIGKSVYDLSPSDLAERYHNMDQALFNNPGTQVYESSVLYFDGTRHDVIFNKATYTDANGKLLGLVGVILDITERKRAEDALRESDQFNREIFSNAKEGIIVYDRTFRYKVWNRCMEDLTGISATQAIGRTAFELFPHLVDSGIDRLLGRALVGEIVTSADTPYHVPNSGKSGWVVGTYGPNRDANGFIIGVIGIIHDITERKRANDALRESEEKYRQLAENVTDVIWTIGMDLKFTYISPSNERITGFTGEEAMALTLEKILTPSSLEMAMQVLAEELEKEKMPQRDVSRSRTFEAEEICKDGHTIWVEIKTAFLRNQEGEPIGIQGISRDISERKRMEEELLRSHCELEQRVKERTEELARKNAEMERFIYTVSHDLRTPLISVGGFLGLIKQDAEEGDLKSLDDDLRIAGEAITKMDRLLQDTLELSRIGRIINPPEDVPFGEIVEDALSQIREKIKSKRVKVTVAMDLPTVHVDRMRIAEVLVNLIENSIKYMGSQDRPEIEIGQRIEGNKNVFFVRDNGIGIDPSQNDKVFELFYKIDNKSEGTGVGLAIVKRIIEVHGGHMWIESELGKGSTIFFTLPQATSIQCVP